MITPHDPPLQEKPKAPEPLPVRITVPGVELAYVFLPLEDITPAETAGALNFLLTGAMAGLGAVPREVVDLCYHQLDETAKRHFQRQPLPTAPGVAQLQKPKLVLPGGGR